MTVFSYTLVDTFHNVCPKQANERFIAKTVKTEDTPEMQTGKRVHKYIEDHVNGVDPLPDWLRHIVPVLESLKTYGEGATRAELKMGVNRDLAPVSFFAPDVYLRGSIDLLLAKGDAALVVDWKTGKKRDKELQLMIYALFVFAVLPMVNKVTGLNYYTFEKDGMGKPFTWQRSETPEMWRHVLPLIHEIEQAMFDNRFPERQSGLCAYCPVENCRHWRPRPVPKALTNTMYPAA